LRETRHPRSRGGGVYGACIHRLGPTFAVIYTYTRSHCRMRECAHCARERKRPMSEAKRTRSVSFRLTDEEHTQVERAALDRKSTRLNSSHGYISYAVL